MKVKVYFAIDPIDRLPTNYYEMGDLIALTLADERLSEGNLEYARKDSLGCGGVKMSRARKAFLLKEGKLLGEYEAPEEFEIVDFRIDDRFSQETIDGWYGVNSFEEISNGE